MSNSVVDGWYCDGGLSKTEIEANGKKAWDLLLAAGYSREAAGAVIGNMRVESVQIDPTRANATNDTYGLVQWHPASKIQNWASSLGVDYRSGTVQISRIEYEYANSLQWINTTGGETYHWSDFKISTDSPESLAVVWRKHYEVAGDAYDEQRSTWARYYYNLYSGSGGTLPPWLLFQFTRRKPHGRTIFLRSH